jgi:hypothetical protein
MKMKLLAPLLVLFAAAIACGTGPSSPPIINLNVGGSTVSGLQGAYCWDQGIGGTICVDPMEPAFSSYTPIPAGSPITLELESPLPDNLVLSLSTEVFGDVVYTEVVDVSDSVDWSPPVDAGEYILTASASWEQGDVTYWFAVAMP